MKKIALPTDFSKNSLNAIDYAIQLIGDEPALMTFIYTYRVHSSSGMFVSVEKLMKKDADRDMASLMRSYSDRVPDNIELDYRIIRGDAVDTISQFALQNEFDLTVLSAKGETGLADSMFGSTTGGLVRDSQIPLLVVPIDYTYEPIQHIVLALDGSPYSDEDTLSVIRDIARLTQASVKGVYISSDGSDVTDHVSDYMASFDIPYEHHIVTSDTINEAISTFAQAQDAQMMCMVRRSRGFFQSLFHSSKTMKEAFESVMPVLIIRD